MRTYSAIAASILPCRISFSALRSVAARSIGTISLRYESSVDQSFGRPVLARRGGVGARRINRIKQRGRPERAAVHVRVAEPCNGVKMIGRCVALVAIEAVARVEAVQLEHLAVARHLRHDRGR